MNELYNNTPSELLNLYVDGELPASMESHLFDQLSHNDGLQSEMRDLLSIRDAVQNDTESFTPPAAAHRGIFDYLGYTYPGGVAPLAVQAVSRFHALVSKAWLPVLSAVFASLITTVVVNNMADQNNNSPEMAAKDIPVVSSFDNSSFDNSSSYDYSSGNNNNVSEAKSAANIQAGNIAESFDTANLNSATAAGSANSSGSAATENKANAPAFDSDNIAFNSHINSDNVNYNNISADFASINSIDNSSFAGPGMSASMFSPASNGQSMFTPMSINTSDRFAGSFLPYEAKDITVMVRFNNARSSGAGSDLATHNPGQFSTLENFSIGFIIGGGELKLGIEAGQEAFAQSFQSEVGGILYNVEQNPLIFWGAVLARYESESLKFYDIQTFFQGSIGGSELGPLGRIIVGVQYITPQAFYGTKLGIQLGLESAHLWYQNQNQLNSSSKSGINFGMSLHF